MADDVQLLPCRSELDELSCASVASCSAESECVLLHEGSSGGDRYEVLATIADPLLVGLVLTDPPVGTTID